MKRLILAIFAILISAASVSAAPTRVQTYYAHQQASGSTCTAAWGSNVTSGNLLVLAVHIASTTVVVDATSLTKSAGTATIGTVTYGSDFNTATSAQGGYYAVPVTGTGSLTLLLTFNSGTSNCNLFGWEVSGQDVTTPINGHAGQRVGTDSNGTDDPADGITSGSITTTVNNCLILAFASGNSQTLSAGTGFTIAETGHVGTQGGYSEYIADQGAAGSINGLFTRTAGAAVGMEVTIIAVAPSGGSPAVTCQGKLSLLGVGCVR